MPEDPTVVLSYTFPPETPGTVDDLAAEIRERCPGIDLRRATDRADLVARAPEADVLVEHGLPDAVLDRAERLSWVQSLSAGYGRYDRDRLREMDVALTTVSGAHAPAIAQQTLAYLLLFERNLLRGLRQADRREWRRYPAGELTGRTLGVVGVGAIGGRVADLGAACGMDVLGLRRHPERGHPSVEEMVGPDDLHDLLGRADYVVLACPLTDETRGLIDDAALASMRTGTVLVNVARGAVVEQDALVASLAAGDLRGAALDVADPEPLPRESPLWDLGNVVVTPHNAGGSQHFPARCADVFARNYERYVAGDRDGMENRAV
ncbi:MAG: D-2-hydroxyacid dehydrogenase [Haloferacaceae archaeon]